MATIRDADALLAAIRSLPVSDQLRLVERVVREVGEAHNVAATTDPGAVIGLFSDVPDVVDEVSEAAMVARERDPLRLGG